MKKKDYIPGGDTDFLVWATKMTETADERCLDWQIAPPSGVIGNTLTVFKTKLAKTQNPNHGKIDTLEKNEARKAAEKACRIYVQGFLAKNPNVTNADREYMRLTVYDILPTSVNKPLGQATASIGFLGVGVLQLHIKHVDGTPTDFKADYGYKIHYGTFADSDPQPSSGEDLNKSKFTRRKKEVFEFAPADVKKTAYFCIRYENSKGETGPWGPMFASVIP